MKKLFVITFLSLLSLSTMAQMVPYSIQIFQAEPGGTFFYGRYFYPASPTGSYFLMYDGVTSQPKIGEIGAGLSWDGTTLSSTSGSQVNADWAASSGAAKILNKPTTLAGYGISDAVSASSLTSTLAGYATSSALTAGLSTKFNTPSGAVTDYIKANGSTGVFNTDVDARVSIGITGKFNNPTGTTSQYLNGVGTPISFPSIPAAQVNSDWNSSSGVSQILNKPVKYSGATNSSGIYAVTYGSAYGSVPNVVITVVGGSNKDSAVLTSTTTGFSVLVERRTDVLGLLPSYAPVTPSSSPTATVNVTVTPP